MKKVFIVFKFSNYLFVVICVYNLLKWLPYYGVLEKKNVHNTFCNTYDGNPPYVSACQPKNKVMF